MQPQVTQGTPVRDWEKSFLACCGGCDGPGCTSFWLTYFLPCVSFGWNRKRAFNSNGYLWGGIYLAILLVLAIVLGATTEKKNCKTHTRSTSTSYSRSTSCDLEVAPVGGVFIFLAAVSIFALGFWNRIQIRQKFGLPGATFTDCLLWWFCPACSLCQETRTLTVNNVRDGAWQGPGAMVVAVGNIHGNPANVQMSYPPQPHHPQSYQQQVYQPQGYQPQAYQQQPYQAPHQQGAVKEYDSKM